VLRKILEKEVSEEYLLDIKKYFHTTLSETTHLGVADKQLINRIVDEVYQKNSETEMPVKQFINLVEVEIYKYRF